MNRNWLRNQWQQLPEAAVRRLQAGQLRHYLRTAVLPFSAHYGELFRRHGLNADSFRTLEDLQRVPFTTKVDLLNTAESPQRFKDFILVPDPKVLARRPGTILRALTRGRDSVKQDFESEFRPIFMTFTTGRSAEPTPFFFSQRDPTSPGGSSKSAPPRGPLVEQPALRRTLLSARALRDYRGRRHDAELGRRAGGGREATFASSANSSPTSRWNSDLRLSSVAPGGRGRRHCENLRCIVLAGEKVSDGLRHKLRDHGHELGAAVDAGHMRLDGGQAGLAECPFPHDQPGGYHLYPDLGIIEVIDPQTGKALPPGQLSELVFTPLVRARVVLRYRTGDYTDGGLTYDRVRIVAAPAPALGNISPVEVRR
jgi:hypothetical protein